MINDSNMTSTLNDEITKKDQCYQKGINWSGLEFRCLNLKVDGVLIPYPQRPKYRVLQTSYNEC